MAETRYILTLSCRDVRGIVAAVTGFLAEHHGFIIESAQYGDESTGQFFLRIEFKAEEGAPERDALKKLFHDKIGARFAMDWHLHEKNKKPRVLIMASRQTHCLNDLMYRCSAGTLPVDICAVISNHAQAQAISEWHKVPFYHLPLSPGGKAAQENEVRSIIARHEADVIVLARYMQVLSAELTEELKGRCINIHHSFLPSFKGAKPYHQAFDRGVKIIGATAHYVTDALDEGPIIEQEVARVDHTATPEDLVAIGRDIECVVLARALKYHAEHRVLLNGKKTVVFK